jgi:hypothetical protein
MARGWAAGQAGRHGQGGMGKAAHLHSRRKDDAVVLERLVDSLSQCLVVGLEGSHSLTQLGADEHRLGKAALQLADGRGTLPLLDFGALPLLDEGEVQLISFAKESPVLLTQRVDALLRVKQRVHVCLDLLPRRLEQLIGLLQVAE